MAKTKLDENIKILLSKKSIQELSTKELEESSLSQPSPSVFEDLSTQRHNQRKWLFRFAIFWSSISLFILFVLIIVNSFVRGSKGESFALFGQYELEVLSVSVFGQLIGIVAIIAKSLWDETPFSEMLKRDYDEKHKARN